jgi:alpha-ribazole phosphatase/probable phosphoglycerate mutase
MRSFLGDVAVEQGSGRIVVIGHSATRWALDHLLKGLPLEVLVGAPFEWQEGWPYELTGDAESTASRSEET